MTASLWFLLMWCIVSGASSVCAASPQRIVSLGPIHTENMYLLGAEDRLVANTTYCTRPEAARLLPKVGSVLQANVEMIVSLHPDLILATGLTPPGLLKKLEELHLNVVAFSQPKNFDQICDQFVQLGKILGLEERANTIVEQVRSKIARIDGLTRDLPPKKVFLQVGAHPLFGAVPGSFVHDYIRLSNAQNILEQQIQGATSEEKVLALNPEVIIVALMGGDTGLGAEQHAHWLSFSSLDAAQKHKVYVVDPDQVCSPSPLTFARSLAAVASLVYPEVASELSGDGAKGIQQPK